MPVTIRRRSAKGSQTFLLFLIKPSHYDNDQNGSPFWIEGPARGGGQAQKCGLNRSVDARFGSVWIARGDDRRHVVQLERSMV